MIVFSFNKHTKMTRLVEDYLKLRLGVCYCPQFTINLSLPPLLKYKLLLVGLCQFWLMEKTQQSTMKEAILLTRLIIMADTGSIKSACILFDYSSLVCTLSL